MAVRTKDDLILEDLVYALKGVITKLQRRALNGSVLESYGALRKAEKLEDAVEVLKAMVGRDLI